MGGFFFGLVGGGEVGGGVGNVLAPIFLISPVAVPSCLTPTVQHWPGGWDVMVAAAVRRRGKRWSVEAVYNRSVVQT